MVDAGELDRALGRLLAAGTLDDRQVAEVRRELLGATPAAGPASGQPAAAVVAAAYIGVGLVAAGVATLIVTNWQDLSTPARLLIFGGLTASLVSVGAALRDRLDVARGLAWLVAVPAAAGIGAAVAAATTRDDETRFVTATACAVALALVLLALRRRTAQMLGLVSAWVTGDIAIAVRAGWDANGAGWLLIITGVVLVIAAVSARLPSPELGLSLGGLVVLVGIHVLAGEHFGLAIVLSAALAGLAYYRATVADPAGPLIVATLTVATMVPRMLSEWFNDSVGASGILALTGIVVLGVAATHVQLSRRYRRS